VAAKERLTVPEQRLSWTLRREEATVCPAVVVEAAQRDPTLGSCQRVTRCGS
jgi:hypothetical protein